VKGKGREGSILEGRSKEYLAKTTRERHFESAMGMKRAEREGGGVPSDDEHPSPQRGVGSPPETRLRGAGGGGWLYLPILVREHLDDHRA
jgi:hypothetical protein